MLMRKRTLTAILTVFLICASTLTLSCNAAQSKKWSLSLAQLVFNQKVSQDYLDISYSSEGDLLIPLAPIFIKGEAEVIRHGLHQWEFKVSSLGNSVWFDSKRLLMRANDLELTLAPWQLEVVFDELLVDVSLVSDLFGLKVEHNEINMLLTVQTIRPWPLELRLAREKRWRRLQVVQPEGPEPETVEMPYQWWGAPQINASMSVAESSSASQTRNFSIQGVTEALFLTNRFSISGDFGESIKAARLTSGRRDPRGGILGFDSLYEFNLGDVSGFSVPLARGAGSGVGAVIKATPLTVPDNFDETFVDGDAPPGWDAELYLDGQLYDFQRVTSLGRYKFEDIPLSFGSNGILVKLYGPNGQQSSVDHSQRVGSRLKIGELHWQAHIGRPQKKLFELQENYITPPDTLENSFKGQLGVSKNLSMGLTFARVAEVDDEGKTHADKFYGINVQPYLGDVAVNLDYSFQGNGNSAYSVRTSLPLGFSSLGIGYKHYDNYFGDIVRPYNRLKDVFSLRTSLPLSILGMGKQRLGVSHKQDVFIDNSRLVEQEVNYGHSLWGMNVSHRYNVSKRYSSGKLSSKYGNYRMLASANFDLLTLRGELNYLVEPTFNFANLNVSGQYRLNDQQNFYAGVSLNRGNKASYSMSYAHTFSSFWLSMNASKSSHDWSFGLGVELSFGYVPGYGMRMQPSLPLERGMALVTATEKLADQPARPIQGLSMIANQRKQEMNSNADGHLVLDNLETLYPVNLSVARTSLPDPFMVPTLTKAEIWPRPGQSIRLPITLVESSFVSGYALIEVDSGQQVPLRSMFIELLDDKGRVRAETLTLDDGFYEFDQAYAGSWAVRLKPQQPNINGGMHSRPVKFKIAVNEFAKDNINLVFMNIVDVLQQISDNAEPAMHVNKLPKKLDILFDFDKAQVTTTYFSDLKEIAQYMIQNPNTRVSIIGHTDLHGSDAYNLKLSKRRAMAVKKVLVDEFNVPEQFINASHLGESQPLCNENNLTSDRLNRRVSVELITGE